MLVQQHEAELAGVDGGAGLRERDFDVDDAGAGAGDAAAAFDLDADPGRALELAAHLGGEAELAEQADQRPGGELVGQGADQAAVHDAGRTLVALARGEAGDDFFSIPLEREVEAERMVGRAAEAGLAGAEEGAVEVFVHDGPSMARAGDGAYALRPRDEPRWG